MKCEHIECSNTDKVWLPYIVKENSKGLRSHSFCIRCGIVKNIGSDKAKGIGYYMNIISRLEKNIETPGSKVRKRLVARELEKIENFEDKYSMNKYNQETAFINIVKKHFNIPEKTIKSFL